MRVSKWKSEKNDPMNIPNFRFFVRSDFQKIDIFFEKIRFFGEKSFFQKSAKTPKMAVLALFWHFQKKWKNEKMLKKLKKYWKNEKLMKKFKNIEKYWKKWKNIGNIEKILKKYWKIL